VRLHGHPLGHVRMPVRNGCIEQVDTLARAAFRVEIRRHLAADGRDDSDVSLDRRWWPDLSCEDSRRRST
jgi:hypothetical protein